MSMVERDYILRMIQQLAQALARVLGLKRAGKLDEALAAVRETADGIFGPLLRTVDALDAQSAASLLGSREKIDAYAALTEEEGSIHALKGDERRAGACFRRALTLYLEAAWKGPEISEKERAAIHALREKVDHTRLAPRYQKALAEL
jgi:hypothetical protein